MTAVTTVLLAHGDQVPEGIQGDPDVVVVPLNAYASLGTSPVSLRVDNVRLRLGPEGHAQLKNRVDEAMASLSGQLGALFTHLTYEAGQLITVHEYWRLVYEMVAHDYPDATVVTDRMPHSSDPSTDLGSLMLNFRLRTMVEQFPEVGQLAHSPRGSMSTRARRSPAEVIDDAVGLATRIIDSLRYRARKARRRSSASAALGLAVIMTQRSKSGRLLRQLGEAVTFSEVSSSQLWAPQALDPRNRGETCHELILAYLRMRLDQLESQVENTSAFAKKPWGVLLTDQEHDPLVRLLIAATLERPDKQVITTPEGAQSLMGTEMYPAASDVWVHDHRIVRCATSQGESVRMAGVFGGPVVLSGYLAEPPALGGPSHRLARWVVAKLVGGASSPTRPLVLVNLDNEPDFGVTRPGMPSMAEKLASVRHLAEALHKNGMRFVVTCKSIEGRKAVKEFTSPGAAAVFAHVSWRMLMTISSVVIQRDSSLGPEAVAGNFPTIVWDDMGLPLASREWLTNNGPWVQYCTDEVALTEALARIHAGIAPKGSPQTWDLVTPGRQVADWIVANHMGGDSARTR